jgi:catechol 2,3-dioxygenase
MAIPAPNLNPPFNIVRLSHVELRVTDLAKSRAFYVDTLGLQVTDEDGDAIYLRAMEERGHHCIVLKGGTAVAGDARLQGLRRGGSRQGRASLQGTGLPVEWIERPFMGRTLPHPRSARHSAGILRQHGPAGTDPPAIQALSRRQTAQDRPLQPASRRMSTSRRLLRTTSVSGRRSTPRMRSPAGCWAAWMHRKGGVHDIAFTNGTRPAPAPHRLLGADAAQHHRPARPDVDDRLGFQHRARPRPARHLERLLPLYPRPDGHRIEIYCSDYQTIDPDHEPIKWDLKDPQRQTLWGAPAPRSWFEEGRSEFEGAQTSWKAT